MLMFGLNRLARGLRSSNPALSVAGLVIAIIGYARSRRGGKDRELLYSKELKPGEELLFKLAD
ncbi:MAG: hypothetical protein OES13_02970 [Acidimicrobiia bacterium]|nr:hypothetical protein [Acidimicrobiia bacterium]